MGVNEHLDKYYRLLSFIGLDSDTTHTPIDKLYIPSFKEIEKVVVDEVMLQVLQSIEQQIHNQIRIQVSDLIYHTVMSYNTKD
jgi:hypothetical protein